MLFRFFRKGNQKFERFSQRMWEVDLQQVWWGKRLGYRLAQVVALLAHQFRRDQILLRASALTFTTLLGIVPLVGVLFSFLKGFGLHEKVLPEILAYVTAQNQDAATILSDLGENVVNYIDQTNVTALGFVSLMVIVLSVGSLLQACEHAFNFIWQVHRQRPILVKIRDYTFILIITPLMLFIGLSMRQAFSGLAVQPLFIVREAFTALLGPYPALRESAGYWFSSLNGLAIFGYGSLQLLPFVVLICLFTFIYIYAPFTRVPFGAALAGGIFGALLWQGAYQAYIEFQFGMVRYNKIYGTLASLPFTLMWIYMSWVILLIGAELAYVLHSLESYRVLKRLDEPSPACRERIAVRIMTRVIRGFQEGQPVLLPKLADSLEIPEPLTDEVITQLEQAGLVIRASDAAEGRPDRILPSRPANELNINDVLSAVRDDGVMYSLPMDEKDRAAHEYLEQRQQAIEQQGGNILFTQMLEPPPPALPESD
jgi:membrane protein